MFKDKNLKKLFSFLKDKKRLSSELKQLKDHLSFKAEHFDLEDKEILEEINFCIREIKLFKLKGEMSELSLEIKEAEAKKNKKRKKSLTEKFSKLTN